MPCIDFPAEAENCSRCGVELEVVKSKRRTVMTLAHGEFQARELRKACPSCLPRRTLGSRILAQVVKPRQRFGYDLIVHVGLGRYLRGLQRTEIRAELYQTHQIRLSEASVSVLCDRFLVYLESLHLLRSPYLRAAMQGGYPLHLDATCELGRGGLLACLDGWRGWVLMAARITSEHELQMRPVIEKTVSLFGDPVATVRDLGEAGARAVDGPRQRGVIDLVCHYHFAAAVGKALFDQHYSVLRYSLRATGVRSALRTLLRDLRGYNGSSSPDGRFGPGPVRKELLALMHWLLEGDGSYDAVYPFSLSHWDFVARCRQALQQAESWAPCPRSQPERRALSHLSRLVAKIEREQRIGAAAHKLEQAWQAFCKLREVLRLTNEELPIGHASNRQKPLPALELQRLQEIEKAVNEYRQQLECHAVRGTKTDPGTPEATILKYLDRYGAHLFGHPVLRDSDGSVLAVVGRTNNVAEHFFGRQKQRLRRRVGRAHLGRDLEQQPAQAALAANLRYPDYVRVLCGSLDNLATAFAALDAQAIAAATPLVRDHRDLQLERQVRQLLGDTTTPGATADQKRPAPAAVTSPLLPNTSGPTARRHPSTASSTPPATVV
jgi:hypothetical protein